MSIFQHELKYYIRNLKEVIYIYSFFISIVVLAPFGLPGSSDGLQSLTPVLLWIALSLSVALAGMNLFQRDAESGRLEYYQMLPTALERIILAKWAALYLFVTIPTLLMLPIAAILLNIDVKQWAHYAIGLGLGAAALTMITCLVAALTAGVARAGAIVSLIILPLSIPVMIFGSDYCRQVGDIWQPNLVFLIGLTVFLLPITAFAGAASIRASN
jgi:heme exporter protein B